MKIVLINPPWEKPGYFFVRAGARWPHFEPSGARYMPFPFFMGYAAAVLIQNGYDPKVIDACAEKLSRSDFFYRLSSLSPDLVLMETSTTSFQNDREILAEMKIRFPNCRFAVAGAWQDPNNRSYLSLVSEADFFMVGEYEETLLELVHGLEGKIKLNEIRSLEFRENGQVVRNPIRPLREDIDQLPFPARHLFPMQAYEDLVGTLPQPSLQIWGSRGCPFGCIFCVWPQIMYRERKYRVRRPERIVDEIEFELKRFPYRSFYFDDDTFNIGKQRILALCDEIIKRKISIPWGIMARADTSDEETIEKMRQAGLVVAKFGVESACQKLVDAANKNLDLTVAFKNIRFAKSLGIKVHLTFAFGLPGETRQTIRKTIETAIELDPDSVQFSIATPYPGSKLFDDLYKAGKITNLNFADFDGYFKAVFNLDSISAKELEAACRYAERKWRKHQIKKLLHHPCEALYKIFLKPKRAIEALSVLLAK